MKYNYDVLGKYIRQIDIRNSNLSVSTLLGVSIEKKFIESHANTVGTDFKSYKIVKKNQFAYGPVTSRNGDKISVAMLTDLEECLVSSSYITFEVIDDNLLNPEYLMLMFCNSEFDRYSRYHSWGSAREVFSWEYFKNTLIQIPPIETQKEIVKKYKDICEYEKDLTEFNCSIEKLAYSYVCSILDKCDDYSFESLKSFGTIVTGKTPSTSNAEYYNSFDIPFIKTPDMHSNMFITSCSEWLSKKGADSQKSKYLPYHTVLMSCIGSAGEISITTNISQTNQQINAVITKYPFFVYFMLKKYKDDLLVLGDGSTTMVNINKTDFENFAIPMYSLDKLNKIENTLENMLEVVEKNSYQLDKINLIKIHIIKALF